jgi:adenine-specific DNA-methyltransferase
MKPRLELTWIGKENSPHLEPRILLEDPTSSYHAPYRVTNNDLFDNRLIFGDNLLALKALEQEFTGKIKSIYIDPPFNSQQAFEHYDDGVEHSIWLSMMRHRLELLHRLLSESGSLFIHIDDNELAYLIAVVDEIFGRRNRVAVITFKQSSVSGPKAVNPGLVTTSNFILYYAKDKAKWTPGRVFVATDRDRRYSKYIENMDEPVSDWRLMSLREALAKSLDLKERELSDRLGGDLEGAFERFVLDNPHRVVRTARVTPKDISLDARNALGKSRETAGRVVEYSRSDRDSYFFLNGEQLVFYAMKTKLIDGRVVSAQVASTIWDDLLSNNLHKEGGVTFPNGKKPEALLKRILELSSQPGDWVLDSFAGSGTTGAVAHKMGRRWIMVELGNHSHTHIIPRLKGIIDGQDPSGVTDATGWQRGGGFRYFRLAPSLLEKDRWGNWVVSKEYNGAMLAAALCKLEGFTYAPSETAYWQHGHSTERDFVYVTTQKLTRERLAALSEEVGDGRSLLVYCMAFRGNTSGFPNLTVKKIPNAVLHRCEWGRDDYSLQVASLPPAPEPTPAAEQPLTVARRHEVAPLPLFERVE